MLFSPFWHPCSYSVPKQLMDSGFCCFGVFFFCSFGVVCFFLLFWFGIFVWFLFHWFLFVCWVFFNHSRLPEAMGVSYWWFHIYTRVEIECIQGVLAQVPVSLYVFYNCPFFRSNFFLPHSAPPLPALLCLPSLCFPGGIASSAQAQFL